VEERKASLLPSFSIPIMRKKFHILAFIDDKTINLDLNLETEGGLKTTQAKCCTPRVEPKNDVFNKVCATG